MSKINSCYSLCPLIDQKSFFGVSDDCDSGYVVVTLGKNMVVRYKLADQKQVNSWNTKVRLSSPVVFDRKCKQYVGVFNSNIIQMWSENDVDLNKLKKFKFTDSIHCVISNSRVEAASSVIVFKNGLIAPLTSEILNSRKNVKEFCSGIDILADEKSSVIEDAHLLSCENSLIVVLVCSGGSGNDLVSHFLPLKPGLFRPVSCKLSFRERNRASLEANVNHASDIKLTGYAFVCGEPLQLISLWSDGSLYCLDFYPSDSSLQNIEDQFPGQKIMDLKVINVKLKVAILPLDSIGCHIAVYGSDPSEEGALLTIINIKHKVVQCKYDIKLYCTSPRLWSGGPTDLLLIVGQHLAVAHYRLVSQKLAALVGSQIDSTVSTSVLQTDWQKQASKEEKWSNLELANPLSSNNDDLFYTENTSVLPGTEKQIQHVKESVQSLYDEGLSEAGICDRLIPTLIETHDTPALIWLLNRFNDIPFHCVLLVISYCLEGFTKIDFTNTQNRSDDDSSDSEHFEENFDEKEKAKEIVSDYSTMDVDRNSKVDELKTLLLSALSKSIVPDNKGLSLVRSELSLVSGLTLMDYLIDFMSEYPGDPRLIDWAIVLLDSYYQSFIMTKDNTIIKTFKRLNHCIKNQLAFMSTWEDLTLLIKMIKSGRNCAPSAITSNIGVDRLYSVDKISLY